MGFSIKLLQVFDKVSKTKKNSKFVNDKKPLNLKQVTERVFMRIIEDINDKSKVDNNLLSSLAGVFEDYCFESEVSERTTKEVYDEIVRRGHLMSSEDVKEFNRIFLKLNAMRGVTFYPRLEEDIKKRIGITPINSFIREDIGIWKNRFSTLDVASSYIPQKQRLTLNINGIRYSLQNFKGSSLSHYGAIADYMYKEDRDDSVLLCLP